MNITKKKVNDLLSASKSINGDIIALEVTNWLIKNVENYVDNTTKYYKLDLVIDNDELPETRESQNIYREIGQITDHIMGNPVLMNKSQKKLELLSEIRMILDRATNKAFDKMKSSGELMETLFKRLSFFYEKIIPNPESKKRANEIDEELKALIIEKDSMATQVEKDEVQKKILDKINEGVALVKFTELDGAVSINKFEYESFDVNVSLKKKDDKGQSVTIKDYNIPEGFVVWMEISHHPRIKRPSVMF